MVRMANKYVYPPKGYQQFDGGKDNKYQKALIPPNESPDCANVIFENGAVETREGVTCVVTSGVGSYVCDGLYTRHDSDGSQTMVGWWGGTGYYMGTATFTTIGSAQAVFTSGNRVGAAEVEDHIFFGDGSANPYKYDGSEFTRHGVPAATGVVSAASIATSTGVMTGDYQWKVTYVNSQSVEGDVGTAVATVALAAGAAHLTDIPTAPQSHGVASRLIYRTEAGGTTFKRVGTISDNSTTTYVDNVADASLGAAAPTDAGEPPKYDVIVYHQGRLWMNDPANPNYVWYTDLWEPYTVASTNFIRVGDNTSDQVRSLAVYQDSIVIGCDKSNWFIYLPDTTPGNWQTARVRTAYGCKSPYAPVLYNDKLFFPATQGDKIVGFASLSGMNTSLDSTLLTVNAVGSDLISDRIEPDIFDINETYVKNISGAVYKNRAYITVTDSGTTNNKIWVYDFSISNVSKRQEAVWIPWTGLSAAQFTVTDGELYYGDSTGTGKVYQMHSGAYNDAGAAIDSYFDTKEFAGLDGHESNHKDFRTANLFHQQPGAYYMNLGYKVDSDDEFTNHQVSLDPGGSLWGVMEWGNDNWGGARTDTETEVYLGAISGKRIQFRFSNQGAADQMFRVQGMTFNYNRKGRR